MGHFSQDPPGNRTNMMTKLIDRQMDEETDELGELTHIVIEAEKIHTILPTRCKIRKVDSMAQSKSKSLRTRKVNGTILSLRAVSGPFV